MASTAKDYYNNPRRVITFASIDYPASWPKADSAKCCIFEALNLVGAARFGAQWTGEEMRTFYWYAEPNKLEEVRLKTVKRVSPPPPMSLASAGERTLRSVIDAHNDPNRYGEHVRAWSAHEAATKHANEVAQAQASWKANKAALERLTAAIEWLAQECRDGKISSFYRFEIGGGPLFDMAAYEWNVDNPLERFVEAGGFNRWFPDINPAGAHPVYVFFQREEIQRGVSVFAAAPVDVLAADLSTLSPYIQFAVKLALAKGYTAGNTPTKEARKAEIEQEWEAGLPGIQMSANQVDLIAFITGFPNPNAIQTGSKGGGKSK